MVVAVAVAAVLTPGAVWASHQFSFVTLYDSGSHSEADIDTAGRLEVADGGGSITIDGRARLDLPIRPWYAYRTSSATVHTSDKRFGLTSVTAYNPGTSAERVVINRRQEGLLSRVVQIYVPPGQTEHITFPSPLVLVPPAGETVTLLVDLEAAPTVTVTLVGFDQ